MDKKEFLEVLRQSLNGEVTSNVIEQNIKYYDQYINASSVEEEAKILILLGDPRLIARTIIEADRAGKQKSNFTGNPGSHTNYYSEEEKADQNERSSGQGRNLFFTNLKWYHKIMMAFAIVLVLIIVALVGRLLIGFLFAFGLPIILILLVMALFRRR